MWRDRRLHNQIELLPQPMNRLHSSVGKRAPGVGVELGQRLSEIGLRDADPIEHTECGVEDPMGHGERGADTALNQDESE